MYVKKKFDFFNLNENESEVELFQLREVSYFISAGSLNTLAIL